MRKQRKSKRSTLVRKLDKAFSLFIRSPQFCEAKGLDTVRCAGVLQCCHIIGRANYRLRWDKQNALCMCQGHHVYYTYHPEAWRDFVSTNFPYNWKHVNEIRQEIVKYTDEDLEGILYDLCKL